MDVAVSLALAGSSSWNVLEHPYNNLTTGSLCRMKKAVDNHRDRKMEETRKRANEAVQMYANLIHKVLIRRYNQSK